MRIRLLPYVGSLMVAFLVPVADAISEDPIPISPDPAFATIYYYQEDVSIKFSDEVQKDTDFFKGDPGADLISIRDNVGGLVYRVKQILGIYPHSLRFNLHIYKTHHELTDAFRKLGLTGDSPVAFYSHKYRTIYISVEKLDDLILAHEIAHAVINSYFTPTPSSQLQEIFAHYVEKNLKGPFIRNQSP